MASEAVPETGTETGLGEAASLIAKSLRRPSMSPVVFDIIAKALDWIALALGFWFANFAVAPAGFSAGGAFLAAAFSAIIAVVLIGLARQHRLQALRQPVPAYLKSLAISVAVAGVAAIARIWPVDIASFVMWSAVILGVALVPGRGLLAALSKWAIDYGMTERRAVLVGGGSNAAELIRGLSRNPNNDVRICGIFDDRDDDRSPSVIVGVPKIGRVAELVDFARSAEIDLLIITLPLDAETRIRQILKTVSVLPLDVRLSAYSSDYEFPRRIGDELDEHGLIDVLRRPLSGEMRLSKRAVDVTLVMPAILFLSPLMLLTALAIRMESKGPVFFKQLRHGYNHKPIEVLKFRSMYAEQCDAAARNIVVRDDPRVTRVGRFIRKWSIDELPQLFNVLRGDLSLVGPRPHALDAVSSRQTAFEEIVDGYAARHKVPPGVTGWAQVNGWRGEVDEPEKLLQRVEHDLYYIENRSIWLDLYILARTPFCLLDTKNAY